MPKEIVSAEEILGQTNAGAEPVENTSPVVETPAAPAEPAPPEAGFEPPPDMAAPSAEEVLAGEPAVPAPAVKEPPVPVLASVRSDMASLASLASQAGALDGQQEKVKEGTAAEEIPTEAQKAWRFVKNIHPGEVITFKDKTTHKLTMGVNVVFDEVLAQKILEVADIFHIVQQ